MNNCVYIPFKQSRDYNSKDLQSMVIQLMRFPLAIAIVFLHCNSSPYDENFCYSFIRQYISFTWVGIAVPIFFLISGFLFFNNIDHFSKKEYKRKLLSRIRSLLIPYIAWNILAALVPLFILVLIIIKNGEPVIWIVDYFKSLNGWHIFWDYNQWGENSTGPIDLPLWFIRDLLILSVATPLIYRGIQRFGLGWILFTIVLYLISHWYYLYFNSRALLFFSIGAYWGINKINLIYLTKKIGLIASGFAIIMSFLITSVEVHSPWNDWLYQIFVVLSFFFIIKIGCFIIKRGYGNSLLFLSQCSFFVFAVHEIKVYEICLKLSNQLFTSTDTLSLCFHYFLYPVSVSAVCVALFFVAKYIAPKLLSFLIGNRIRS